MPHEMYREIKVVFRSGTGDDAWLVQVDPNASIAALVPELIDTLPIDFTADDLEVETEGSIADPVIVLQLKSRRHVGKYRPAD